MTEDTLHYNQIPRRKAEFIRPPNTLKAKVGSGGLSDEILDKAQHLLENNSTEFAPLAELYMASLMRGIETAKKASRSEDPENLIALLIYPAMQLKANGGMFNYLLVTRSADKLVQFLEVIERPDESALEIVIAFVTTIRAITIGKITGDGGKYGHELIDALNDACIRYFEKNPGKRRETDYDYVKSADIQEP